ncbi:MAG TPA: hypothetical protein VMS87_10310 [Roseiarcus sp.]|nr:hypothetical protein [Roseiarcus sp.]
MIATAYHSELSKARACQPRAAAGVVILKALREVAHRGRQLAIRSGHCSTVY